MLKEFISNSLEILTIVGGVFSVLLILILVYNKVFKKKTFDKTLEFIGSNYLLFGFIVSLLATLGSLFYSEIMGFTPCLLCWYQRILMYPQSLIFGIALYKNDFKIKIYSVALSLIGVVIATYHYSGQIGVTKIALCSVVGYSAACSDKFFVHYGYVTIPMMALTAFVMLVVLGLVAWKK